MRKTVVGLVLLTMFLGLVACSGFEDEEMPTATVVPSPTVTQTLLPTVTLDPCAKTNIAATMKEMVHYYNEFVFTRNMAASLPNNAPSLPLLILDMEKTGLSFSELDLPSCLADLQQTGFNFMNATVIYMGNYMTQSITQEDMDKQITTAQGYQTTFETQSAQLLGITLPTPEGPVQETPTSIATP